MLAPALVVPPAPEAGKPCTLVLSTWNLNRTPICYFHDDWLPEGPMAAFVHDSAGRAAPLAVVGEAAYGPRSPRILSGRSWVETITIEPGCAMSQKLPLNTFFDLSRPGTYTRQG